MHGVSVVPLVTGALVPVVEDTVVAIVSVVPVVGGSVVPVVAETLVGSVSLVPLVTGDCCSRDSSCCCFRYTVIPFPLQTP